MKSVELLIPVYNGADTLDMAIRSALNQTVPFNKITVVDDASTDNTPDIIRSYENIRYIRNDRNMGCCGNWNESLQYVSSPFVSLLHADDLLAPNWHEHVLSALDSSKDPESCCMYLGAVRFRGENKLLELFSFAGTVEEYDSGSLLKLLWKHCFYGLSASACMVYSVRILKKLGFFPVDEYPAMADVPLHWELLIKKRIIYDPAPLVFIRLGAKNQDSSTRRSEHSEGALKSFCNLLPEICNILGYNESLIKTEYFLPYWLMGIRSAFSGNAYKLPMNVRQYVNDVMRDIGLIGLTGTFLRYAKELTRRKVQMRIFSREIKKTLTLQNIQ